MSSRHSKLAQRAPRPDGAKPSASLVQRPTRSSTSGSFLFSITIVAQISSILERRQSNIVRESLDLSLGFEVVRGRGRRGIDSLYEHPSDRSKLSLTILDYRLPNMGDIWATIEIDNRKLRDVDLLVGLCTGDVVDISFRRFGSIWPGSTLSQS
jgi:hypothetical protein